MNKHLYPRLAVTNMVKNKNIYLPYLLAGTLIVSLFYILSSVSIIVSQSNTTGSGGMGAILMLSSIICGLLSLVVLYYINSFIMKRRKKEFGLFSILGMEKKHIAIVLMWEVLVTSAVCILLGIVSGALFSQLMLLFLLKIVGLPAALTFQIPVFSVVKTVVLFAFAFFAIFIFDMVVISRTDPISLLHSNKTGEREPKSRWLIALLGVLALGGGYGLAWMVKTPSDAVGFFFFAVLLVIIGTYCLFIAGSIVWLKLLRKNKRFYYKPKNFITVSGMLYRMKQNATGLANICILSTCLLVTLSSTVCLFVGEEETLNARYPYDMSVTFNAEKSTEALVQQATVSHARQYEVTLQDEVGYYAFSCASKRSADTFTFTNQYGGQAYEINCVTLADYNRLTGADESLSQGEALITITGEPLKGDTITLNGQSYKVKKIIPRAEFIDTINMAYGVTAVLPAYRDLETMEKDYTQIVSKYKLDYIVKYNVEGDTKELNEYFGTLKSVYSNAGLDVHSFSNKDEARMDFYAIYGSILFVGIFFVALFLIATVLIIYYKQITEGFDDRERFSIMQKVGMSHKEVKNTIQKQVLTVFFLPLGGAVLHIAVAFRVLCILLRMFDMTNTLLFLGCTVGSVLVFAILYYTVYQITAKTYYRILQGND